MSFRAAWCAFVFTLFSLIAGPGLAQQRDIELTPGADYFGFDLRTEQDVTLDQCTAVCLADPECRAFTYNARAKWCFLKSDWSTLNPFPGAVAGKVVDLSAEPDIGAPPALDFLPAHVVDEARLYRQTVTTAAMPAPETGLLGLISAAEATLDGRAAMANYAAALRLDPDNAVLWADLSRAAAGVTTDQNGDLGRILQDATSAGYNAYQLSRTAGARADALAALARALAARGQPRPALEAYKASLELAASPEVQAAYEELKAREGFRVVDHTVDSDNASPRICVQFSEELAKSGVTYADFLTVDGRPAQAVEAAERQLCAEGLGHGQRYRVVVRSGLPSAIGEVIESPVALEIYVRDRAPSIRFTGENFVLPSTARRGIPLVTINTDVVELQLHRVGERALAGLLSGYQFLRQLDGYDVSRIADELGAPVWEGEIEVGRELNKEVVTSFPVDEAVPERKAGVYVLVARPRDDRSETWESRATQWFVVSDIGLATYTGEDGLTVFARSLATAKPLPGAELTLLARNNEVLGTATADADGRAVFSPGLTRGAAGMAPAAMTAKLGDDFVFLDMTRAGFDLSDRGVEGRAAPGAVDVYSWTERGIYRAGETVHAAALARDGFAAAIDDLPLTFVFHRPDGREDRRFVSNGAGLGGHAVALDLPGNAMRGTWQLKIFTDPEAAPVSQAMFLVEDFVPDRIEFELESAASDIEIGGSAEVTVDGRYLYGAPAAGLGLEGELVLATTRERDPHPGYLFGLADEAMEEDTRVPLQDLPLTGDDGKATFDVSFDTAPATTRPLQAEVVVRMRESGGRAVERRLQLAVVPEGPMIGIRPEFAGEQVPEGSIAAFRIIAVDAAGERQALDGLDWSLVKLERNYQWYRSGNSWNYEPVSYTRAVSNGRIDIAADAEAVIRVPVEWGRYRLEVASPDPSGPATSVEFEAGYYVEASSTETPDGLEIALDRPRYKAGETAKLKIAPRFAGELLVTVGSDRLLQTFTASVPEGGATLDIPVSGDWGAGAYVTAALYRPGDAEESRLPSRAIGVKWLAVDPAERKLAVVVTPPEKTQPRGPLTIPVSVDGLSAGEEAYVAVAAVDVGILNLTSYKPPAPSEWYFGQRRMSLEMRDLYGRLIDGSLGATGRIRTGGDGAQMTSQGSAPTEQLVAFFSGPVRLGDDGKAEISFHLPQFNGTVRVMAVAWTKTGVGEAQADVVVRDPVVVTASLPRFLAPGDRAELRLDIANTDGPAGDYQVSIEPSGGVTVAVPERERTIALDTGARRSLTVPIGADAAGAGAVRLVLSNADGLSLEQELALDLRPSTLPVTTREVVRLAPNASLRIDGGLFSASLLDGASVSVGASTLSAFDVPSLLMSLDRYPYGCAEQTTSRALPLLYVSELSDAAGLEPDPALKERVQDAIHRVLAYQSWSGSFGLWGPGSGDLWLDAYVTDFLTRAREQGYDVPQEGFNQALDNLRNSLAYDVDLLNDGNEVAYALYVLARNSRASIGDLRYYVDTRLDEFVTPMGRAQLAASMALYGDAPRAERAFASAFALIQERGPDLDRADYGSKLRDGAAILALAAETRPLPAAVPAMVRYVSGLREAKTYLSTQEQAWILLAARAIAAGNQAIALEVDGSPHAGAFSRRMSGEEVSASPLVIANKGSQPVDAVVTALAAPVQPLPAGGEGFTIERSYYRLDGTPANVTQAVQNERFVAVVTVTEENAWPSRVLVTDLLPAGFEIDNPRIMGSAELQNFSWLGQTEVAHAEFRDDRFVAALDRTAESARSFTLAYVVRAVTPGSYAHPAAYVEDMYRPQFSARTATGAMEVSAARP